MNFLSTNLCLSCECPPNQSIHWSRSVLPPPTSWQLQRVLHSSWMNRSIRRIWNSAYFNINVLPIDGEWVLPRMRLKTRSYLIPLRLDSALGGEVPSVVDILQFPEYTSARQYIHGNGNNFYLGRSNNFCCNYCTAPIHLAIPFFTLYLYSHRLTVGDLTVQFPTFCTCHFLSALVVVSLTLSELSVPSNSPHPLDYIWARSTRLQSSSGHTMLGSYLSPDR